MSGPRKEANATPYHCGLFLEQESGVFGLAIAWRRVGAKDYGVYISGGVAPHVSQFMAEYSEKGEIRRFYIRDELIKPGQKWDEERLSGSESSVLVSAEDTGILTELAERFFQDWMEAYGALDAARMIQRVTAGTGRCAELTFEEAIQAKLPLQLRAGRMPDFWASLVESSEKWHFSFCQAGGGVALAVDLLLAKMHLFVELI